MSLSASASILPIHLTCISQLNNRLRSLEFILCAVLFWREEKSITILSYIFFVILCEQNEIHEENKIIAIIA